MPFTGLRGLRVRRRRTSRIESEAAAAHPSCSRAEVGHSAMIHLNPPSHNLPASADFALATFLDRNPWCSIQEVELLFCGAKGGAAAVAGIL